MINWKVRFNKKNIVFISQVIVSVVVPVLAYFGMNASDLTTWGKVGETFVKAINRQKPASAKGRYIKSAALSLTMSPSLSLDVQELLDMK